MIYLVSWGTGVLYKNVLRPGLFWLSADRVHEGFTKLGEWMGWREVLKKGVKVAWGFEDPRLEQEVMGINFANPIGLAAGFDYNARLTQVLPSLGFGFAEVGTVTLRPYEGNPKPRLGRLPKSRSLIVNKGFRSQGADRVIRRLLGLNFEIPVGISIGKTNDERTVKLDEGIRDYRGSLEKWVESGIGDYITINISCPNTKGGEPSTPRRLERLLRDLRKVECKKPVLIKMPINKPWREFRKLVEVVVDQGIEGVIIGNLNKKWKEHPELIRDAVDFSVKGSLSGKPTWELSNELIAKTYREFGDKLVIVGCGGVFNAEDAYYKMKLGACLIQLITGLVFEGPQLVGQINRGLVRLMRRDGYTHVSEVVGRGLG